MASATTSESRDSPAVINEASEESASTGALIEGSLSQGNLE